MSLTELPDARRYSIRVTEASGKSRRLGRMRAEVRDSTLVILTRSGEVSESWPVVASTRSGNRYDLIAQDGSTITLGSCGCGS